MIDFTAPQQTTTRPDAGYASWQASARKVMMRHDLNDRTAGPMPSFGKMVHTTALAASSSNLYAPAAHNYTSDAKPDIAYDTDKKTQEEAFSFGDVIDIINPLQHLPVIGMIYRKITGDDIKPMASIIGGGIFGGPIGAVSGTVNAIVADRTGKDVAENALSMVGIDIVPSSRKPDIDYVEPVPLSIAQSSDTQAVAAAYEKIEGTHNFAAKNKSVYSWNA